MTRTATFLFTVFTLVVLALAIGCGGGGGTAQSASLKPAPDVLRGVWTATLEGREAETIEADLTVSGHELSGYLRLTRGEEVVGGTVSGTAANGVSFVASLEGGEQFTFESSAALAPGAELRGSFRFKDGRRGEIRFRKEHDRSLNIAGDWTGTWSANHMDAVAGTWSLTLEQDRHQVSGRGTARHGEQERTLVLRGTIVGRKLTAAVALGDERAAVWKGVIREADGALRLEGRYAGNMLGGHFEEGILTGVRGSGGGSTGGGTGGGHEHRIQIRPEEFRLPPGGIETLRASADAVEWSQRSEDAEAGEFVDARGGVVRFRAPLIGGKILIRATSKRDPNVFGTSVAMVTGATGALGRHEFRTVHGAASVVSEGGSRWNAVEIPFEHGVLLIRTPLPAEPQRFEIGRGVSVVLRGRERAHEATSGVVAFTRVGDSRLSGRFEVRLGSAESTEALALHGVFDVPRHAR